MITAFRSEALFGEVDCEVEHGAAGSFRVRCATLLEPYPADIVTVLRAQALHRPQQVLFREVHDDGRVQAITYHDAWDMARAIASTLRGLGAQEERPVALIAENSVRAGLVILACYLAGVPVAPISSAYSKLSQDHEKLRYVIGLLDPAVIVFDSVLAHRAALSRLDWRRARLVVLDETPDVVRTTLGRAVTDPARDVVTWQELTSGAPIMPATASADAIAKILFTSGSTGMPKGVINTHAMMMSNQQALTQIWPAIAAKSLRMVDWLPWNHTFGGNQNFNMAIFHGGTLTIDRGKPTAIAATIRAIKEVRPTVYFNVPRGLDALLGVMQEDRVLQETLFGELALLGYAGAALPAPIWTALRRMAREIAGRDVPILGMWGATETGPVATAVYRDSDHPGNIGLPLPGCELKFVPEAGKLEMLVRAPSVTPGYWRQPELTTAAFDDDGFYRIGDAGKLVNSEDVREGILFDGRLGENFKLLSGTWVNVGALRVQLVAACQELIADAAIAGENRTFPAALIFPKLDACRRLCGSDIVDPETLLRSARVREQIGRALAAHNRSAGGSSNRIGRAMLLSEPPSIDGNEMTDKGYLNQRAVLHRRGAFVERLYAAAPDEDVLLIEG
jgi:feruloyl-CoA synthase